MKDRLWGEVRSRCQRASTASVIELLEWLGRGDATAEMWSYVEEHVSKWPEPVRSNIPYAPSWVSRYARAQELEVAGARAEMLRVLTQLEALKPDAIPAHAMRERDDVREHVRLHGWADVPFERAQTRRAFATIAASTSPCEALLRPPGYCNELPDASLLRVFQKVCVHIGVPEDGDYMVCLLAREDAWRGIAAFQVMLQDPALAPQHRAIMSYLRDVCASSSFMGWHNAGRRFERSRGHVFVDLEHLMDHEPRPGFATPTAGGEGAVQRVLSGGVIYRGCVTSGDHQAKLVEMSSQTATEPLGRGTSTHWDTALYDLPEFMVARLDRAGDRPHPDNSTYEYLM